MKLTKTIAAVATLATLGLATHPNAEAETRQPNLVVQITIDALRGDFLTRYDYLFAKDGGFKRLLDKGYWYQNAHYQHANTETIVGHTSLATGAAPSVHGMIANAWFDRQEDRLIYNIEDANYSLLTPGAGVDQKSEIDHTQRTAKNDGRSPVRILSTTLSDEIFLASNGKAKVFAVSVKDRGAVSMAGHSGKAFWFSKASGQFVTSSYYYDRYPAWTEAFNQNKPASRYADTVWNLTRKAEDYVFIHDDDQSFETALPGFGRVFPHAFGPANNKYFNTFLTLSPAGDELTLDFAKTLIQSENLGVDDITDYIGISFSSNDYVGHVFGGSSLENEDNLVRLDKTLGHFLSFLDKKVGLKNTVIVLSADHGQPEAIGYLQKQGISSINYFDPDQLTSSASVVNLEKALGTQGKLIENYFHPYVSLNESLLAELKLDLNSVESSLAEALLQIPGVRAAVTSSDIKSGAVPNTEVFHSITQNFHPSRSGNIHLVFEPNIFVNDFDGLVVASSHGSPWEYDRHVPVIIAGKRIPHGRSTRPVTPYALAPTLAQILGIAAPSGSVAERLSEVLPK